jgi:5-methylcytosine-specific restriction protein A
MMATTSALEAAPTNRLGEIPRFAVGQAYRRRDDIHLKYGGSWQNGISSSSTSPAIFLFTGDTGEQYGYRDGFDEAGVFSYSGEGQVGDMTFRSGNKSVRDHAETGRGLYLFKSTGKGNAQRFVGEFTLANHSVRRGPDRNGDERDIIVFHLLRVSEPAADLVPPSTEPTAQTIATPPSLTDARIRAIAACSGKQGGAGQEAVQTIYARSGAVRDYVILRAQGKCEGCLTSAPFMGMDGLPYLEAHHTTRLSDGGIDHPRFVAALCPTCHRRVHYGSDGRGMNQALQAKLKLLEPDD